MTSRRIWAVFACVAVLAPGAAWGELAVTEEVLGPAHDRRMEPTTSADGLHYAYVTIDAEKNMAFVVHDGTEGPRLTRLHKPLLFSADGTRFAYGGGLPDGGQCYVIDGQVLGPYEAVAGRTLAFSPDGKRVIYAARSEGKSRVYVDGQPQAPYDRIHAPVVFSPDGKRYLYKGRRGDKWVLVVDGKETGEYDDTAKDHPVFSPDSKRVACHACTGPWEGGDHFVLVDGVRGPSYEAIGTLSFSPDGKRLAYKAKRGGKWRAVIDGREGLEFDAIGNAGVVFSPDASRYAYLAMQGDQWLTVVDGEVVGSSYDSSAAGSPTFSPDSAHVVVHACRGEWENVKHLFTVDGEEQPEYDFVTSWRYSADARRFMYEARRGPKQGGKHHLVLDGRKGPAYDDIWGHVFSPDGRRTAYVGQKAEERYVVVDGVPGPAFDGARSPVFSPDSQHVAAAVSGGSLGPNKAAVMLDGELGPECDTIVQNGPSFVADDTVQYLAIRAGNLVRITQRLTTPQ
ncbi:MAG: hypothetical protein ACE5R4_03220 [Armatimonadota bacterium]